MDTANGAIALVGYSNGLYLPFMWRLSDYSGHDFFQGTSQRNGLAIGITQMEGIAWNGPFQIYLTNEQNILNVARLWGLDLDVTTDILPPAPPTPALGALLIHPNPVIDLIQMDGLSGVGRGQVTDMQGRILIEGSINTAAQAIDLSSLTPGGYLLMVTDATGLRVAHMIKR